LKLLQREIFMIRCHFRCLLLLLLSIGTGLFGLNRINAEDPKTVLPDVQRTEAIQEPAEYFGFPIGERHLRHDQVVAYCHYLAESSPRVSIIAYGETHGQRPLLMLAISSPENIDELPEIRRKRARLTSGRYRGDIDEELLVIQMGYCVHGDEASAINSAVLVAYHLASAEDDFIEQFLSQSIALIDPALNPDGVDRFANWANENRGRFPSASPADREHHQPWPGGRTNYYFFDLNRDWLPAVHPESRGRMKLYHQWKPNVVLDFHEMGAQSSYFFQPGDPQRFNPLTPSENVRLTKEFAKEHAAAMDTAGELYFTGERFDDFYIGKGSTYPDLQGAVGILFEQGSTRGLEMSGDRTQRHFRDTVANQVRTSLSSIRAAQRLRQELLKFQVDFFRQAAGSEGQTKLKGYLLAGTKSRLRAAAELLKLHHVRAFAPESGIQWQGRSFDSDEVLVIPLAQPQRILIQSLMEIRQEFEKNIFYDVSTWHLPSAFDLEMHEIDSDIPDHWLDKQFKPSRNVESSEEQKEQSSVDSERVLGWAIPPVELEVPRVIAGLHRLDAQVRVTTQPSQLGEVELPQGTFVILQQPNEKQWSRLQKAILRLCRQLGVEHYPITSALVEQGSDWGSDSLFSIPVCNPLLVVGSGTQSYSAGSLWHFLDVRLGQPALLLDADSISSVRLDDHSCIILPAGTYSSWGESAATQLKQYVQNGGTVIAIGSAVSMLERRKLISSDGADDDSASKDAASKDAAGKDSSQQSRPRFDEVAEANALEQIAGAFFQVSVDQTHPLAYGFPGDKIPVFRNSTRRYPLPSNPYQMVAQYDDVIAGYVSQRNRDQLRGTAAIWVQPSGSGRFILFADDPIFRGYVRGSERFLTNAIYLGPALRIPSWVLHREEDSTE
jgi:hypothetical protein